MRRCPRLAGGCLVFLLALAMPARSAAANLAIVVSGDSSPYVELADTITANLSQTGFDQARVLHAGERKPPHDANPDAIVAVGMHAVQTTVAANLRAPVVGVLIPRATVDVILRQSEPASFSAVYLDQPIARQLDLIRLLLPARKRIGAILGPDSEHLLATLRAEARVRGLELHPATVTAEADLFPALETLLREVDVLLSLPDSLIATPNTIQNILFAAYRYRVPVIAFSPAYVRAGALAAVHSTPAQLGQQVVELLQQMPRRPTPTFQFPRYFSVSVNRHVAHSLGIKIEDEAALAAALGASARRP